MSVFRVRTFTCDVTGWFSMETAYRALCPDHRASAWNRSTAAASPVDQQHTPWGRWENRNPLADIIFRPVNAHRIENVLLPTRNSRTSSHRRARPCERSQKDSGCLHLFALIMLALLALLFLSVPEASRDSPPRRHPRRLRRSLTTSSILRTPSPSRLKAIQWQDLYHLNSRICHSQKFFRWYLAQGDWKLERCWSHFHVLEQLLGLAIGL